MAARGDEVTRIKLPTKSKILGRTLTVDLGGLRDCERFWEGPDPDNHPVWQRLADDVINQPYLDYPLLTGRAVDLSYGGFTVHHRNHDVTHAVRQREYADKYLSLIEENGNEKFTPIAAHFNADREKKTALELAIYLCRSGRTNERSGKDDPSNAARSAEVFEVVASRLGYDEGLIRFLKFAMATHKPDFDRCADLIAGIPGENKREQAELMKGIIDLSHHTDLVRCKTGEASQPVRAEIEHDLRQFLDPTKIDIPRATTNILLNAIDAAKVTGTRVKYREFRSDTTDNVPELKVRHTQDVSASRRALRERPFDPHRFIHEGRDGEFQEIMRQAALTGKLDLTNLEINAGKFELLRSCIASNELREVSLLGTTPEEMERALHEMLIEKERAQDMPMVIAHTRLLEEDEVERVNAQFLEGAKEYKRSMRFEPSRLAAAHKKGGFWRQVGKEISGDVPQFGGEKHFSDVVGVRRMSSPDREAAYEATKHHIADDRARLRSQLQTIAMPEEELGPGEVLLYHGTSPEVAAMIMRSGFDEERCAYVPGNGYGPVGRGVYFTPDLAKAATFSKCGCCGEAGQCGCVDELTGDPVERSVLLSRVFIGKPEVFLRKGDLRERSEGPSEGFDAAIGLGKRIDSGSEFRSTEVCVPRGAQALPLYEIRFISQPNLLHPDVFEQRMIENGLAGDRRYELHLANLHTKLSRLSVLKENHTDDTRTIQSRAQIVERDIGMVIDNLELEIERLGLEGGGAAAGGAGGDGAAPVADHEIALRQKQLNDMRNLRLQIRTLQHQLRLAPVREERAPSEGPQRTGGASAASAVPPASGGAGGSDQRPYHRTRKTSALSLLSKLLPAERKLKTEISELQTDIEEAVRPREYLDTALLLLDASIKRDSAKKEYPPHRIQTTQAMIALKDSLESLREGVSSGERDLNEMRDPVEHCLAELDSTISGTPDRALAVAIQNSTNYKTLRLLADGVRRVTYESPSAGSAGVAAAERESAESRVEGGAAAGDASGEEAADPSGEIDDDSLRP